MLKPHQTSSAAGRVLLIALSLAWTLAALGGTAVAEDTSPEESDDGWNGQLAMAKRYFGPGDNRIRLAKKFPDSRIRLAKKAWDNRIRLSKKGFDNRIRLSKKAFDNRIRLSKKAAELSSLPSSSIMNSEDQTAVPYFDSDLPYSNEFASSSTREMPTSQAADYDEAIHGSGGGGAVGFENPNLWSEENNKEVIDRIVQLIINKYNRQNLIDKRGFIRLV